MSNAQLMVRYFEARIRHAIGDERGDVPGWVMITLMTAAIAAIIWGLAGGWLRTLFDSAMSQVDKCKTNNPGDTTGTAPGAC